MLYSRISIREVELGVGTYSKKLRPFSAKHPHSNFLIEELSKLSSNFDAQHPQCLIASRTQIYRLTASTDAFVRDGVI